MFLCTLCQFGLKNRVFCFFFLQKLAYFTTKNDANKLKRNFFSKTAIESAKKHWNPANTVFGVKIWAKKNLKNRKKNSIALIYPFFGQDNCQNVFHKIATKSV